MESAAAFVAAAALAWGSGLRLYAVVFCTGLAQRLGWVELPGELSALAGEPFLLASGILLLGEFLADKVPVFDSLWDGLQTFARVPGGMALAWAALGDQGPAMQALAALLGGGVAGLTHLGKSGARLAVNHAPEPFTNWTLSLAEDGLVLFGLWLAWQHPWLFLGLLLGFLLVLLWLLPRLWRVARSLLGRLARRIRPAQPSRP
ncbi:MAG: hypothetical protein KatS3mg126_0712 [Lysobacteraceae bacterium]|nr:MAG: hypothetical protein KatS3mg126_0712 [Xanthomonadaceae bacterium]